MTWVDYSKRKLWKNTLYSFFSCKTLGWLLLLRPPYILLYRAGWGHWLSVLQGASMLKSRIIMCLACVIRKDICLGTREKNMLESGINRKEPSVANVYKMHGMHKNLHLLWISNRWSCQAMVKKEKSSISDPPRLFEEETRCIQLSAP